ncbi:hypothetical protein ACQ27_gp265 [Klebsiella phage K64-1]|nr:hypothetical protein ACQ27_gp265 [Klebsiella phage K64-1]
MSKLVKETDLKSVGDIHLLDSSSSAATKFIVLH